MKAPNQNNTPRELVPQGNHVATLYNIIYIGTIETPYLNNDGTKKRQNKIRLTFELPNEKREFEVDGEKTERPLVISKECTFSMYKGTQTAVLRTIAHALIGASLTDEEAENFDVDDLLGKSCMIEVSHEEYDGSKYAKAVGFGSIPAGLTVPARKNELQSLVGYKMSENELEELPEFLQNKIKASDEWKALFDPAEIARKKELQDNIDNLTGTETNSSPEIGPEDVPF